MKKISIKKLITIFYTSVKLLILSFPLLTLGYNACKYLLSSHNYAVATQNLTSISDIDYYQQEYTPYQSCYVWADTLIDYNCLYLYYSGSFHNYQDASIYFETLYSKFPSSFSNVGNYISNVKNFISNSGATYNYGLLVFTNIHLWDFPFQPNRNVYGGVPFTESSFLPLLQYFFMDYYLNYFLSMLVYLTIVDLFLWFVLFLKEHTVFAFEKEEKL